MNLFNILRIYIYNYLLQTFDVCPFLSFFFISFKIEDLYFYVVAWCYSFLNFYLVKPRTMHDLSFLTRDWTQALAVKCGVLTTGQPGSRRHFSSPTREQTHPHLYWKYGVLALDHQGSFLILSFRFISIDFTLKEPSRIEFLYVYIL